MSLNPTLGLLQSQTTFGEYNNILFAIERAIAKVQTATLVKVVSCTNSGTVSAVGSVNVQILVNQQNGAGVGIPEGQLVNLPYLRMQGGTNAVIIDPQPGDIGIAVFASRDISTVVATKAQATPPTFRMYDFSDGMYLGGLLNGVPNCFLQFVSGGIVLTAPGGLTINSNVTVNGSLTATGDIHAEGTSLHAHIHGGVTTGSGDTGAPL
jgi:hypothetical protein